MKKLVIGGIAAAATALALAGAASAQADPAPPVPAPVGDGPLWTSPLVVYNGDYDDGDEDFIVVPVFP